MAKKCYAPDMFGLWRQRKKKVFVGLSGGVDSGVSAALLKEQGYDVVGVFIRIALPGYPCQAGEDKLSAMRVAAHLRIPFMEIDLSDRYAAAVFKNTVSQYGAGRTPNPDTLCNREIKFGAFFDFAKAHGADFVATGHYAQIKNGELYMGADSKKDQSYFLWMVPQAVLGQVLFPVGGMEKPAVRALAEKYQLPNAARKDSQGLCFLGDLTIEDMLRHELTVRPGAVLSIAGKSIGTHDGAALYTLGQRHGFMLTEHSPDTKPHFVVGVDVQKNTITVSTDQYPTHAKETVVTLQDVSWIGEVAPGEYQARFRYRQPLIEAKLMLDRSSATVVLAVPRYVPQGQSLVLYQGERCLGGGVVAQVELR
jgi:tRNA-specific 2-thiouridylase